MNPWLEPGVKGIDTAIPYRLPELLQALTSGEPVYIVEGEADVHALKAHGTAATCNAGGAGKWTAAHSAFFRGSTSPVTVVADWDDAGRAHASTVAASLAEVEVVASLVRAATGKDARDHLTAGHSLNEFIPVTGLDLDAASPADVEARAASLLMEHDARVRVNELLAERAGYRVPTFDIVSPSQAAEPLPPLQFLVEGFWAHASHGVLGGKKKALKSYLTDAVCLAVASGKPLFGQFAVPGGAQPVFMYVGEGGLEPRRRNLQRMARELFGCDLADTLLHTADYAASLDSEAFKTSVGRVLREVDPVLVVLDALYAFHPAGVAAGNLYERGPMLHGLSATVGADRALIVVDHFNKTAQGIDLDSLAQAGMAQWADSWVLLDHYRPPSPATGEYGLRAEIGSRQWGGASYSLDWSLGAFDPTTSRLASELTAHMYARDFDQEQTDRAVTAARKKIVELLRDEPFCHTKTAAKEQLKGSSPGSWWMKGPPRDPVAAL